MKKTKELPNLYCIVVDIQQDKGGSRNLKYHEYKRRGSRIVWVREVSIYDLLTLRREKNSFYVKLLLPKLIQGDHRIVLRAHWLKRLRLEREPTILKSPYFASWEEAEAEIPRYLSRYLDKILDWNLI